MMRRRGRSSGAAEDDWDSPADGAGAPLLQHEHGLRREAPRRSDSRGFGADFFCGGMDRHGEFCGGTDRERPASRAAGGDGASRSRAGQWVYGIVYAIADLLPPSLHPVHDVLPRDLQRLQRFGAHCAEPFDESVPQHRQELRELWAVLEPQRELPPDSHVTEQWKRFGFQGTNPATDFRGGGRLGLSNLLYFAVSYPDSFQRVLHPRQGVGLPFAIAGINLTLMLLNNLRLTAHKTCLTHHAQHTAAAKLARRSFAGMLIAAGGPDGSNVRAMEQVFGDVYCAAFVTLDRLWWEMDANLMSFNQVLAKCKTKMDELLRVAETPYQLLRAAGVE
eukprot:TRINITY_DN66558_c0_g1_i1.p2 TRINITY_DN66558_c0_g1~~TRINITY_DN66558_c0_g1_i1.p2  ORF type:complete len:334 (+),score=110.01 TRINITY_DN66558_c0_g1_i1:90-1091(+)